MTRVHERWTDCLNQDLPDSWGFSGWRVSAGSGMVVCALYACSLEITRVHERFRVLDRLSESGFAGFLGILRMASASWIGNGRMSVVCVFTRDDQSTRAFTSVYERWTDCLNQDLPDSWIRNGRTSVVCVFTRDDESPRAFTRVCERFQAFIDVSRVAGASNQIQGALHRGSMSIARESTRDYESSREIRHEGVLADLSEWRQMHGSARMSSFLWQFASATDFDIPFRLHSSPAWRWVALC